MGTGGKGGRTERAGWNGRELKGCNGVEGGVYQI